MERASAAPRPQSGDPSRHVPLVETVVRTEPTFEPRFLNQGYVQRVRKKEEREPSQERERAQQGRLPEEHAHDADDHRVAHVAVDAAHHEPPRGIPRGQCAFAHPREQPDSGDEEDQAEPQETARKNEGQRP